LLEAQKFELQKHFSRLLMDAEIKFEIENGATRDGIVAVGSYLSDAAARLGVTLVEPDEENTETQFDVVTIKSGAENLSTPTSIEMRHLTDEQRAAGERIASQTRIQREGEIVVMVKEKAKEKSEAQKERQWRKEFEELPFEKKFATLVELETVALSDTLGFIVTLPHKAVGKIIDVLANFGLQIEKAERETRRPPEHKTATENGGKTQDTTTK
jgi:Na+-transporting NADH:ubiquinone oxidoreductase subunit NqrF